MVTKRASEDLKYFSSGIPVNTQKSQFGDSLWTVDEVAEYLKLQPETIRSMARRGELPAIKLGKVWRFNKTAIHELMVNRP